MILAIGQASLILILPLAIKALSSKNKLLNWVGPTALCYLAGILWGNLPVPFQPEVSMGLVQASVPMALPLLLFSLDLRRWRRLAKTSLISFSLAVLAVLTATTIVTKIFSSELSQAWRIAGLLIGVYIGGTSNMSAIGMALDVPKEVFVLVSAADVFLGGIYLLLLMTLAKPFLLLVLPNFSAVSVNGAALEESLHRPSVKKVLLAILLSLLILVVSAGLSWVLFREMKEAFVILSITTLALAASFWPKIRALEGSYEAGEYILLVFSTAIGSLANFSNMLNQGSQVLFFTAMVLVLCVFLQVVLAVIFRIDADTTIMTSTATIFGPAFVGSVAAAIKNKELVVTGLVTSLAGFAAANYIGVAVAYLLKP